MQEIDKSLDIGYAVQLVDINGDGKLDIVVVDTRRVVWYENPTWKRHTIIDGMTQPDNVCLAAHDIDGDGKIDIALGAGWRPFNTKGGGTLQWLKQPASLDQPWKLYPIAEEPTLHRIRWADVDGSGKLALLVAPLMGRNATAKNNWTDGAPVRLLAYRIPKDPTRDRWAPEVIDESLHVMHNLFPVATRAGKPVDVLTASYVGVHRFQRQGEKWVKHHVGVGNQANPKSNRGASEIKQGRLRDGTPFIATIEPWHGNQVVVYTPPEKEGDLWRRQVLDEQLRWGHAVWCADLDGDGGDELVIGVRDNLAKQPGQLSGVRIYRPLDAKGHRWGRQLVDEGGVAVEDLACGDLDGDGRIDLVAVGRATRNVRVYFNQGK
ncbi:MAG: VCBS repeat-containing protein [Gemmataceae bacterium]